MERLIDLTAYPVINVLDSLLKDKTTKKNIIFATDSYKNCGYGIEAKESMTKKKLLLINDCEIQPRVYKTLKQQSERTKNKAEVFTPSWICNQMNNHCDEAWFGRKNVFNKECNKEWITNNDIIDFNDKSWKEYVNSIRLEITCGEAPYIVSRYDTSTGELIPIEKRIGILDRKLRVINENVKTEKEWLKYVYKAYQSVYGYEYQGDNLLIARINLLITFVEYLENKWDRKPTDLEIKKIVNIITWNFWQMDGLNGIVPFESIEENLNRQMSLFDTVYSIVDEKNDYIECIIYDWGNKEKVKYNEMKEGK